MQMLTDITAIVQVDGSEPLVIKSNNTVSWLSQQDDLELSTQLIPQHFNKEEVRLCKFRAYKYGTKTDLIYHIDSEVSSASVLCYKLALF